MLRETGRYRATNLVIQYGNHTLNLLQGAPVVKQAMQNLPMAKEVTTILVAEAAGALRNGNREKHHRFLRQSYATFLASHPEQRNQEFAQHHQEYLAYLADNTAPEDYSVVGATVQQYLIGEVAAIRGDLEAFRTSVVGQMGPTENTQGLRDQDGRPIDLQASQAAFMEDVARSFNEVHSDLESVARLQDAVVRRTEVLEQDVAEIRTIVESNSRQIEANTREIRNLSRQTVTNSQTLQRLEQLQIQTAALVEENSYRLNTISDVLYNNVGAADKLKLISGGAGPRFHRQMQSSARSTGLKGRYNSTVFRLRYSMGRASSLRLPLWG